MPAGLTELLASGEAKYRRRGDAVDQYLAAPDRVAKTKPGALGRGQVRAVLRLVGIRNLFEFCLVADLGDLPFDHNVKTFSESVAARRKNAMWIPLEVLRLALLRAGAEIHRVGAPDGQQRGGCGRPSGRTVESQSTSASSSC